MKCKYTSLFLKECMHWIMLWIKDSAGNMHLQERMRSAWDGRSFIVWINSAQLPGWCWLGEKLQASDNIVPVPLWHRLGSTMGHHSLENRAIYLQSFQGGIWDSSLTFGLPKVRSHYTHREQTSLSSTQGALAGLKEGLGKALLWECCAALSTLAAPAALTKAPGMA